MAVAAISTKPPTISHVSGAPRQRRSSTRVRAVHRIDVPMQPFPGMQDAAKPPRPRYQQGLGNYESARNQGVVGARNDDVAAVARPIGCLAAAAKSAQLAAID